VLGGKLGAGRGENKDNVAAAQSPFGVSGRVVTAVRHRTLRQQGGPTFDLGAP
jgi:hypothetical protein